MQVHFSTRSIAPHSKTNPAPREQSYKTHPTKMIDQWTTMIMRSSMIA